MTRSRGRERSRTSTARSACGEGATWRRRSSSPPPLQPPGLVALFPSSSYNSRYDMVFQGGAFYLSDGLSWNLGQAIDVRRRVLTPNVNRDGEIGLNDDQRRAFRERWLWHLPLKSMDALELKRFAPGYFDLLNHPSADSFWDTFDIEAKHNRIQVPAFHLTGWYDTLLSGTLRNFVGLRARAANETATAIPASDHRAVDALSANDDELEDRRRGLRPECRCLRARLVRPMVQVLARWARWPRVRERGRSSKGAPVKIFVMGANEWRDEQEWPLA